MPKQKEPKVIQEIMGNSITKMVMWGTACIGVIGIVFAAIALLTPESKVRTSFGILQYVFGALLPLWGTWIGTILAYYYSRENFETANRSVQQIVDKMTSEKKLESVKARDVMIERSKLIVQKLENGEDISRYKLKEDCIDFVNHNKIKRVIILDSEDRAKYVIHRDLISYFITNEILAGNSVDGYTLKDMYERGSSEIKSTFNNSVKFISQNSSLLEAKRIMDDVKYCQDVFLTENANPKEPIIGWITNVTIRENSIV